MAKVILDAMIPREDFEATGDAVTNTFIKDLNIQHLEKNGFFLPFLRKPDFQRETNEWDSKKVCQFLESYVTGDLIPSLILWRSNSGYFFVIDGAHRLSALIAWMNDDYGDGSISNDFFDNQISEDQRKIAEETRKLINRTVGSYKDIKESAKSGNADFSKKAMTIGCYSLNLLWVSGDAKKAEQSFFKINQQGVPLNNTETKLIKNRNKPNCIAARAIKTGGTGHKYWGDFNAEYQAKTQKLSEEINKGLFTPPLLGPVKTSDIPIAGKISSAQTLSLILDFVNITNDIPIDFGEMPDDLNGETTVKYLKKTRDIVYRINSMHPSSLGLHPIVYFYTLDGRHKPASFYAIAEFVMQIEKRRKINDFIKVREDFERLLLKYNYLAQQVNDKYKYANKSYKYISNMYLVLIDILIHQKTIDINQAIIQLLSNDEYNYLKIDTTVTISDDFINFTTDKKSAIYIKEFIENPIRCNICNGFIHCNSITIDHIIRKEDGGIGSIDNGQLSHPYCNSTFKN